MGIRNTFILWVNVIFKISKLWKLWQSDLPTFSMRKTLPCLSFICLLDICISSYVERDYVTNPCHILKSLPHSYTSTGTKKSKGTFWSHSEWDRSWPLFGTFFPPSHSWLPWFKDNSGEGNGKSLQYSCLGNPWTEEPGRLQSMGSQRVRYDLATKQQHRHI